MRISGRRSQDAIAAAAVIPVDARIGRPVPPEDLTDRERVHFERLALARRPGWYSGAEGLLAAYCTHLVILEDVHAQLIKTKAGASERYRTLVRMHRQEAELVARLGVKLRLTPSSKMQKSASQEADDRPMEDMGHQPFRAPEDPAALVDENGERSFERLRQSLAQPVPPKPERAPEPDDDEPEDEAAVPAPS